MKTVHLVDLQTNIPIQINTNYRLIQAQDVTQVGKVSKIKSVEKLRPVST